MTRGEVESIIGPTSGESGEDVPRVWWDLASGGRLYLVCLPAFLDMRLQSKWISDMERYNENHGLNYPQEL